MAYKNIVFVKLEKRLLNDPRWWTMSDYAQLIYIKLILLAADTYNRVPLNDKVLSMSVRSSLPEKDFSRCLEEIRHNFAKFKKNKHFQYFQDFDEKTNWYKTKQSPSNRRAIAELHTDKDKDKEKEKEKDKETTCGKPALFNTKEKKTIQSDYAKTHNLSADSESARIRTEEIINEIADQKNVKNPIGLARAIARQA